MSFALSNNVKSIVQFMAWPGPGGEATVSRGEATWSYLQEGLEIIAGDSFFGAIEMTTILDPATEQAFREWLTRHPRLSVIFSAQPIQLQNLEGLVSPFDISDPDEVRRREAVARLKEAVDAAYRWGATQLAFVSGRDVGPDRPSSPGSPAPVAGAALLPPTTRELARGALIRSIAELAAYSRARAQAEGRAPLLLTLEIFDRRSSPGCKCQLIGPAAEAVALARTVRDQLGIGEFGLLYDLSHMLLAGDHPSQAETPEVLRLLAPYLNHVHLGTCVTDPGDPLVGDTHPGFDYPGSAVGDDLLCAFVRTLVEIDYRGPIGFEVKPVGSEDPAALVASTKAHFLAAASRLEVRYAPGSYAFRSQRYFPLPLLNRISETRRERGERLVAEVAAARRRRSALAGTDGKLVILAADHPARNVTRVGDDPLAMGDRLEYLGRTVRVVASPWVDGVMATPDIIEDLFLLEGLAREAGLPGFLDEKVIIGSMNRTGLAGLDYEMDDRLSAFTAARLAELGCDGAKLLFRLDSGPFSRYSIQTMAHVSQVMNDCRHHGLPVFLEPLPVERTEQGYRTVLDPAALIRIVGIASAMGESSLGVWLKIPYVEGYADVVRATTLPILMLGGESRENPLPTLVQFERGMGAGANVRGALVGRNILYPGRDDPAAVALAVYRIVHQGYSTARAIDELRSYRDADLDRWKPLLDREVGN
ncbi:MAG TPA: TIM barrel protein [Firmicutes bacterium]|nr:TIM barrel protein [Bacillota bacterium]